MEGYCLSMQNTLHCLFVFPLCHIHTSGGSFLTISIPRRCIALVLSFAFSRFSFILWLPHSLNTFTLAFIIWKTFCLFLHCGSQISPILTQLSNAVILKPKWRWVLKKKIIMTLFWIARLKRFLVHCSYLQSRQHICWEQCYTYLQATA